MKTQSFAFEAQCVVTEHPDGHCHLVGFADKEFDTRIYLMLQRAFEFDEQDVELGMNTYHVEWCGQENSGYGGISQFLLKTSGAEVIFSQEVAEALDGLKNISISFKLEHSEFLALIERLRHIFDDNDCLKIIAP